MKNQRYYGSNSLPSNTFDKYWLSCIKENNNEYNNIGKWMLFFNKKYMDEKWLLVKELFKTQQLDNVIGIKCSTSLSNDRVSESNLKEGIIIFYCSNSFNKEYIILIGNTILNKINYDKEFIYYKTDEQTYEGTHETGCNKNHSYRLKNPKYKDIFRQGKFLILDEE